MEIQRRELFNQAPAPTLLTDVQRRVFVYPGHSCQRARGNVSLSLLLSPYTLRTVPLRKKKKKEGKEDLELFLTRSKALGVIRSGLK